MRKSFVTVTALEGFVASVDPDVFLQYQAMSALTIFFTRMM